jgi:hypothetical protein
MSDRNVREGAKMASLVAAKTSADIRQIQKRAYRGALRTAGIELFVPTDLTVLSEALSLDVIGGRWSVTAEGTFHVAAPATTIALRATIGVADPNSGEVLDSEDFDFPVRGVDMTPAGPVRIPITVTGSFVVSDPDQQIVTVSMMAYDELGGSYEIEQPRLLLMPW